jgi:hypothetical protein
LECQGSHEVELFLHFGEKCRILQRDPHSFVASIDEKRLTVRFDSRLTPQVYRGSEDPVCGWMSPVFGVRKPIFTIAARANITGSTRFITEISAETTVA